MDGLKDLCKIVRLATIVPATQVTTPYDGRTNRTILTGTLFVPIISTTSQSKMYSP